MIREGYNPDIAIPPGETLQEYLDAREMTQMELSKRLGLAPKTVNEIIKGKAPITPETALSLEPVFGIPARFWISLEANFQETKARLERDRFTDDELLIAKEVPYSSLVKLGVVPRVRKVQDRVHNLRSFFGVASLTLVRTVVPVAFRRDDRDTASSLALASWLRIGETMAGKARTARFDEHKLRSLLPSLRSLTMELEASDLPSRLRELCATCGVVLTFVPHLPKTYVSGATHWLTPDRVLVQLSLRRPFADIIWFNLFHELAHVLLHGKREVYVSEDVPVAGDSGDKAEQEANTFASEQLVPGRPYRRYLNAQEITQTSVRRFAREIGVHPCVVVGRLQHDGHVPFSVMNNLRPKLSWEWRRSCLTLPGPVAPGK